MCSLESNRQWTITDSDNGLSPNRRQAIIWTNDGIYLLTHICVTRPHWVNLQRGFMNDYDFEKYSCPWMFYFRVWLFEVSKIATFGLNKNHLFGITRNGPWSIFWNVIFWLLTVSIFVPSPPMIRRPYPYIWSSTTRFLSRSDHNIMARCHRALFSTA